MKAKLTTGQSVLVGGLLLTALACSSILPGCNRGEATEVPTRADLVVIDVLSALGPIERPPVVFPHDLHTDTLAAKGKDCDACHLQEDSATLALKFMRLADEDVTVVMDVYHDKCVSCHQEIAEADQKSGPVTCGECHRREPLYQSSRQPFGFDKSLHYRHIKANDEKCESCHHLYNDTTKELVYVKGQENPCRDCHRLQSEENRSSFRLAAHQACVACHRDISQKRPADRRGPYRCEGCHDLARQLAMEVVEKPPRLKRNQPDFVLLSAAKPERDASKLKTVPFSHVGHEEFNTTCRACHHETLAPCNECHTLAGGEKSDGVTLQQAMHSMTSDHSCIGCHQTKKSAAECAGCHVLMQYARLSERACNICHAGPPPPELESVASRYKSLDDFRPRPSEVRLSFASGDIPDSATIKVLSEQYGPAVMPHRRILDTLRQHIENSRIARHFHGHEDIVCQGCHHYGPMSVTPPLCENCHSREFEEADPLKPGLMGAYHLQCLGCHRAMGIEKPKDCVGCHAKK